MSEEILKITASINACCARARTADSAEGQLRFLRFAVAHACDLAAQMNGELNDAYEKILFRMNFSTDVSIPLREIVLGNSLSLFANRDALCKFLQSCIPLFVAHDRLSHQQAREIITDVRVSYERFMDQSIAADDMRIQFSKLEGYFCRPPGGDGGTKPRKPKGDGGLSIKRLARFAETLSTYAAFFVAVYEIVKPWLFQEREMSSEARAESEILALTPPLLIASLPSMIVEEEVEPLALKLPSAGEF